MRSRRSGIARDALRGALAGAAATWVMGRVTTALYERESRAAREREEEARGGRAAYGRAAERAAQAVGAELSDERRRQAGTAIHWATGIGAGAAYGAARGRVPGVDAAGGLLFGAAFFLLVDEGANVALGLTPGPAAFPWQTHARGLAGHLAFGAAADAALRLLDRAA